MANTRIENVGKEACEDGESDLEGDGEKSMMSDEEEDNDGVSAKKTAVLERKTLLQEGLVGRCWAYRVQE